MSVTTIGRTAYNALVDDDGTGTTGSVWDKADVDDVLDAIDALFSSSTGITLDISTNSGASPSSTILTLQATGTVAHGITAEAETATFGGLRKIASAGGVQLLGLSSATTTVALEAYGTTDDTTKSNASVAYNQIAGWKKSGTTVAAAGANANVLAVRAGSTTRFILDADGDSHQDVGTAWTNFDFLEDVDALTALSVSVSRPDDPLRTAFAHLLERYRPELEQHGIVTFNTHGGHFVNWSRTSMLVIGAVRQQAAKLAALEAHVQRALTGGLA